MGALEVASLVLAGLGRAAELAALAIQAARENNEAKALALLDEALANLDAGLPQTRAELEAIKRRIAEKIDAKFPAMSPRVLPPEEGGPSEA